MFDGAAGVLAIWNDIRAGRTEEFEAWFKGEHLTERLAVPGFRLGRRYEAIAGAPHYFVFYVADTPGVLTSPAYLDRLNNPTPLTRSVMTHGFVNMNRTVCRRALRFGTLRGATAVTARFAWPPEGERIAPLLERMAAEEGIARCELWLSAESGGGAAAVEERLRGGDRKIAACIMIDALREPDAVRASDALAREFHGAEIGVYRFLCELARASDA